MVVSFGLVSCGSEGRVTCGEMKWDVYIERENEMCCYFEMVL